MEWIITAAVVVAILILAVILPTEYISPMELTLDSNYIDAKPIIDVETSYYPSWYGHPVEETRAEGWYGMVGDLAGLIRLNSEFSTFNSSAKGTSTEQEILPQKRVLMSFMRSHDFVRMAKFMGFRVTDSGAVSRGIAEPRKQYALYIFHGTRKWEDWSQGPTASRFNVNVNWFTDTGSLDVPPGTDEIKWVNPAPGVAIGSGSRECAGIELVLQTPRYYTDIALNMNRLRVSTGAYAAISKQSRGTWFIPL